MSYASDHLAWKQRVSKEVNGAKHFNETYVPLKTDPYSPLKGLAEKYSVPYSFSNPNDIGKYDLKTTIQEMELINRNRAQRQDEFRKSASLSYLNGTQGGGAYESTSHATYNLYNPKNKVTLKMQPMSPKRQDIMKMLAKSSSTDVLNHDKYPRPKNFFHQAYIAKSKVDAMSIAGSKRSRSIGKFAKAHYPPGHPKHKNITSLPKINLHRFNEKPEDEYSVFSKQSKQRQNLKKIQSSLPAHFVESGAVTQTKRENHASPERNHAIQNYSRASSRTEELKSMLIETIQHMNDQEIEVMKTAIDSIRDGGHTPKRKANPNKVAAKVITQKPILNEIKEDVLLETATDADGNLEVKPADEKSEKDENEELRDNVDELPILNPDQSPDLRHKAAVPSIKSRRSSKSLKSSKSSQYLAKLQDQINREREERLKLQSEIEEIRSTLK